MLKGAFRAVASLRLTIALLVGVVALLLAGVAIPQKSVLQRELFLEWRRAHPTLVAVVDALGLADVHRSWLAVALWTLFFLNLAAVMARRVPAALERVRVDAPLPDPADAPGFPYRHRVERVGGDALRAAMAAFQGRGWTVHADGARFRAVRHRFVPLLTLAFHLSFFLVLAGGVWASYTRFEGFVELAQGQTFDGEGALYVEPPRAAPLAEIPRARFLVEEIVPAAVDGTAVSLEVKLRDTWQRPHLLEINRPYREDGTDFVFLDLGVAPLLVVRDRAGRELDGAWVRLKVSGSEPDRFELLGQPFEALFSADGAAEARGERTSAHVVRDPLLRLTMVGDTGQRVSAAIRPGEALEVGPYRITFADWRYWVKLYVRSERGLWWVFAGFGIAAIAVTTRLLLYRREYLVALDERDGVRALVVAGRAEYYRALFADEFERAIAEVARRAGGAPGA